jgi:hypothetical protein
MKESIGGFGRQSKKSDLICVPAQPLRIVMMWGRHACERHGQKLCFSFHPTARNCVLQVLVHGHDAHTDAAGCLRVMSTEPERAREHKPAGPC